MNNEENYTAGDIEILLTLARLTEQVNQLRTDVGKFVSRLEFENFEKRMVMIERLVYGMVALILTGVIGALLTVVLK